MYAPILNSLYNLNDNDAEESISSKNALTVFGIPWPPYLGSQDNEVHPSSIYFLYASLYPGGVLTTPFSKIAGCSSPAFAKGKMRF